jgi:pyruvate dehydrogenase E1 component
MLQPAEPEDVDVEGILKGIYRLRAGEGDGPRVQILASGVAVPWALQAQQQLREEWGVVADVWSVTSWTELRRDGLAADREAYVNPTGEQRTPYVTSKLADAQGPFVAVSDYDHLVPDQIRAWVPGDYLTLGADGFGFSDTRPAVRRHFLIDTQSIVTRALQALARRGEVDASAPAQAIERYRLLDVNAGTTGTAGGDA